MWQSGLPFFDPSVEPKLGFERREAAPSGDEHESPVAQRARLTTESLIAQSCVDMATLLSYAAVCCISQSRRRIQRLATAAAATLPGLPAALSRSFKVFQWGT